MVTPATGSAINTNVYESRVIAISRAGVTTTNDCGRFEREPIRGQLTLFVRRASWWEMFRN